MLTEIIQLRQFSIQNERLCDLMCVEFRLVSQVAHHLLIVAELSIPRLFNQPLAPSFLTKLSGHLVELAFQVRDLPFKKFLLLVDHDLHLPDLLLCYFWLPISSGLQFLYDCCLIVDLGLKLIV